MTESSTERAVGRAIAWEDVRVGDTIRAEYRSGDVGLTTEGVVAVALESSLSSAQARYVARSINNPTLTLIDRPKPQLPIEVGSVIVNATIRGVPGQVATLMETYGGQFWRSSITLAGVYAHDPEHITEWTPGKVVPA